MVKRAINRGIMNGWKASLFRMWFYILPNAKSRTNFLRKHKILAGMGEHIHWQPRFYPTDPYCLFLHNNIAIATNVTFFAHDIINHVYNGLEENVRNGEKVLAVKGCIEIEDNVFIGWVYFVKCFS